MSRTYNKKGKPITIEEWCELFENSEYKIIKQEELKNGKWVSTVWLGLDHNFSFIGKPIIFETMVFSSREDFEELDMRRYSTLKQAEKGHAEMVKKYR